MQLDMGSSALGQFFTPYTVSYAMAESSFDEKNAKAELSQKGYISVLEPTVGGGANVIAFCEVLKIMTSIIKHNVSLSAKSSANQLL